MAHFAQLDENNVVTQVIVVSNDDTADSNGVETESIGVAFCQKLLGADTNWKQTSYNNKIRTRYAGVGYTYDAGLDAFISPKPFASWTLDSSTKDWKAPIDKPTLTDDETAAGKFYAWDETVYQGDNTKGWVLKDAPGS